MARSPYLFVYNATLAAGWAYVVYLTLREVATGGGPPEVKKAVDLPLKVAQTAAILEVVHSMLGVVRSPFFTTFIQVLSRQWAVWGIVEQAPYETCHGGLTLFSLGAFPVGLNFVTLLLAWGVTEVLRYSFFAVKEVMEAPYALLWARYSFFIVLYPLGVASEMTMAYLALPVIRAKRPLSVRMPNVLNWAFDYYIFCWVAIACYLPGLPILYLHMLKQRTKVLRISKMKNQ